MYKFTFFSLTLHVILVLIGCVEEPKVYSPVEEEIIDTSAALKEISALNFDSLIIHSGKPAVVEFYSPYCHYCTGMESIVNSIAEEYRGRVIVGRVNTVEDDTLKYAHGIYGLPTFLFIKDGIEVLRIEGAVEHDVIAAYIDSTINM